MSAGGEKTLCDAPWLPNPGMSLEAIAALFGHLQPRHSATFEVAAVTTGSSGSGATSCLPSRLTDAPRGALSASPRRGPGREIPSLAREQTKLCVGQDFCWASGAETPAKTAVEQDLR
jgi:hypothetical protein